MSAANESSAPQGNRLRERYTKDVVPALAKEFGYTNVMAVPQASRRSWSTWAWVKPRRTPRSSTSAPTSWPRSPARRQPCAARRSRWRSSRCAKGMPIGAMVTLRGDRMYDFLDRLVSIALPRVRDFRGVSPRGFDGRGNYTLGLRDQLLFTEIDYLKVDKARGMNVCVVTTAKTDEEARKLLQLMGMPFRTN